MDLLRLAGAPGVGKSTTAWAIAQRLADEGVPCGYVDTDQLGMCYPAPDDDSDRWALKERALAGVAEEFWRAGVQRLVVSGVAFPDDPPPQIDGISVRSVWLDASEQTRRERLGQRGSSEDQLQQYLAAGTAEAARVESSWERISTDGWSLDETVDAVLSRWHPVVVQESRAPRPFISEAAAVDRVLWVTGPRLAGASRIGWEIASEEWGAGRRLGFADLAQLSFAWNINGAVGMANIARVHGVFRDVGADVLVVVAPLEVSPFAVRAALPNAEVSFVRLVATGADVRAHARSRARGDGPALAGDDLIDASDADIEDVVRTSLAQSSLPLREHEQAVDTRGLSLTDAAAAVRRFLPAE
ncbi:AAA family ATPase [Microbacterium murale]|uniref:Broad-specificity NMP kinase n=1 Tax=Microbacterium murale TaxID=1081040 RepID=A0ABU0P9T8_9MICO|nr:hypothetical protein [Microbacterium murale]MDQ0644099.1 broad-specificity NMP kinase [Microbacterium murale]